MLTLGVLQDIEQVRVGVCGALDDKLLEQVLKQLVDLVLLEVRLDSLRVIELLQFVHFSERSKISDLNYN